MLTKEYVSQLRDLTGFSDYKIAQKYQVNQSNFSKYSSGKAAFSETHAFLFAGILGLDPAKVMIDAKIEHCNNTNNFEKLAFWQKQREKIKINTREAKIIISQFNPIVGDIRGNTKRIIKHIKNNSTHDLIIFPELALCGYPPEDLLLHNGFKEIINEAIKEISEYSKNIDVIVGCPVFNSGEIYNSAIMFRDGKIFGIYNKQKLPNYGVFDEKRYFSAGNKPFIFQLSGVSYALLICEDTWSQNIINSLKNIGVEKIISINASPYSQKKHSKRLENIALNAKNNLVDIIYVNMVGAQDGLVFDGGSFVVNKFGEVTKQLPFFEEQTYNLADDFSVNFNEVGNSYNALVLGLKDYYEKSGCFKGIIVALSGGIDSALSLAIASDAIGSKNIKAVMMPYIYTSNNSLTDARDQVKNMQINYQEINIKSIVVSYMSAIDNLKDVALENIQARVRGNIVMSIANSDQLLLLSTSNKSESSVGYATLYGDMSGGFSPLKDVYKTDVYALAKYRNTLANIIPPNVLFKEPTAELAANQFDSNTLPPYSILDKILKLFIEEALSAAEIINKGFNEATVKMVISMVKNSEYKRFQSPLGTKFSEKSFDKERRYPIVNKFNF